MTLLLFPSSLGLPLAPTERQTEWPSTRTVSEKPHGAPEGRTFACLVLGPPATTTTKHLDKGFVEGVASQSARPQLISCAAPRVSHLVMGNVYRWLSIGQALNAYSSGSLPSW